MSPGKEREGSRLEGIISITNNTHLDVQCGREVGEEENIQQPVNPELQGLSLSQESPVSPAKKQREELDKDCLNELGFLVWAIGRWWHHHH